MDKEMDNIFALAEELKGLILDESELSHVIELETAVQAYHSNIRDYYETDLKKIESGGIRVEKAFQIMEDIVDVIAAAKDFSQSTERQIRGSSYLEKSSVERTWLVQDARNGLIDSEFWLRNINWL